MYMHDDPIETVNVPSHFVQGKFVEGRVLKIYTDPEPMNPRTECDNFGHMVCFHTRHSLGDEDHGVDQDDFSSWTELENYLRKEKGAVEVLPMYMYDHSGITVRTHSFADPWDSGQVGFIYATRKDILENWGAKRLSKELRQKAIRLLNAEVQDYDDYLTGNVYGYILEDEDGNELSSCWGYAGDDAVTQIKTELYIHVIRPQLLDSEKGEA
jgi:hypothetical protein